MTKQLWNDPQFEARMAYAEAAERQATEGATLWNDPLVEARMAYEKTEEFLAAQEERELDDDATLFEGRNYNNFREEW